MTEVVLLVEPDGLSEKVRGFTLTKPNLHTIIERCHLSNDPRHIWIRTWICTDGERALTGQRMFREVLTARAIEPAETPRFDELDVTLPFHADETPNGFRRKWLRKK